MLQLDLRAREGAEIQEKREPREACKERRWRSQDDRQRR